jgi:hypothetical protein
MTDDDRKPLKLSELAGDRDERGLICKKCGCRHFNVKHTRRGDGYILRERKCRNCGRVVWTNEKIWADPQNVALVPRGGPAS